MGYDIADYKLIDPRYGTNEDIDVLIAELKKRDMKLMMDLVVNHTSDQVILNFTTNPRTINKPLSPHMLTCCYHQHDWFKSSISSPKSPKRDWYIWKPPKGHDASGNPLPPNNWCQILGDANSAWTYDKTSNEYYLSLFTPEQPDLNWENPDVRAAIHDVMRFWLDKGVCGYRMDVINYISKDQRFPDAKETIVNATSGDAAANTGGSAKYHSGWAGYANGPRLHEFLRALKKEVLEPYKAVTVGEMPRVNDIDEIIKTVRQKDGELNMIFIFDVVDLDNAPGQGRMALRDWAVRNMVRPIVKWQTLMIERNGWNSVFIENHDNPRSVSRFCDDSDEWREKGAKLLALLQTTLGGTIFVYQGEEIGMRNMPKDWDVAEYKDIESINYWKKSLDLYGHDEDALKKAREVLEIKARDHARTPMQWDASPNAGFCSENVKPWMRVMDDFKTVNADVQSRFSSLDDESVLQYWKRRLAHRKEHADVFVHGAFQTVDNALDGSVFAYLRTGKESGQWLVVLNFSGEEVAWSLPGNVKVEGWMVGTYGKGKPDKSTRGVVALRPWEGLLGMCSN